MKMPNELLKEIASENPRILDDIHYCSAGKNWWVKDASGSFRCLPPTLVSKHLQTLGVSGFRDHTGPSKVDRIMIDKAMDPVYFAGPVAGYQAGLLLLGTRKILVTESCVPMKAKEGDATRLKEWIFDLVGRDDNQYWTLLYWLHFRRKALLTGRHHFGQLLVLAGPAGCGKSFFQSCVITPLLGGRMARPYRYMAGQTAFNSELFAASHLAIEDETPARDLASRRSLGNQIKVLLFTKDQSCHPKGVDAFSLRPLWTMSLSVNAEPENLMILPPIDESLADKIIILLVQKPVDPMRSESRDDEGQRLAALADKELPAFAHELDQLVIPTHWEDARCGVRAFQNPTVMKELQALAPEEMMHPMISETLFSIPPHYWKGSALQLQKLLCSGIYSHEAKKLLSYPTACGVYLARLAASRPAEYSKQFNRGVVFWVIQSTQGNE